MKPFTTGLPNTALPNLDDIVFENRNKAYGAYDLRKFYSTSITRAMFVGVGSFLLLLIANHIFANSSKKSITEKGIDLVLTKVADEDIDVKKIVPPKPIEPPKEVPQAKTRAYLEPEVVEEAEQEMPPPTQDELETAIIGTKNIEGPDATSIISETPPPVETPAIAKAVEIKESNEPFITVEVQPSFTGGMNEMYKFLAKNLNYPSAAQIANVQGKVFLKFIVEKDGSITNVETLKGIGFGCDEEAARVVKMMPKWTAGKQNGRAVRVIFTIPVFFKLD